jgi:uncharacterized membrane protein YkvA (DUF1232 family)
MAHESHGGQSAQNEHDLLASQLSSDGASPEGVSPVIPHVQESGEKSEVMQRFWEAVKRLPAYIRLATSMARDPAVPKQVKGILAAGGAYAVSPIDLIPGIIPVAGQLDDVYVLLTAIQQALKRTPADVADRHLATATINREDIDGDLRAVRDLVRTAAVKSVVIGGKALGRVSRAAFRIANEQLKRRSAGRAKEPR